MNLLQIIQTTSTELGLVAPTTAVNSADLQVRQLVAIANREGQSLYRDYDWTTLQTQFIINVEFPTDKTGNVTINSTTVTGLASTTGLDDTYAVSGTGQPQAQRVSSVSSATTVELSMESTATETGTTLTFAKDTYDLPDDFDHYIGQTWWDRTNQWRLIGPDSPQMAQYIRSGIFATGPRVRWRQVGKLPAAWQMWPPPTSQNTPDAFVFEYVSKNWVQKIDGTYANTMTADTDVPLLDDQAIILGLKWRMWQQRGFDYAAMQAECVDYVSQLKGRDGGSPDLFLNRRTGPFLIGTQNIQDGFWPGPGNP